MTRATNDIKGSSTTPLAKKWYSMIKRCYSPSMEKSQPCYNEVTVCEEWLLFSSFKSWAEQQDWKDKHLDKDLLVKGNKVYSPTTCCFVDPCINYFITENKSNKGEWPTGVSYNKDLCCWLASISNPFSKKVEMIGFFYDPDEAHQAWKKRKLVFANKLAESISDNRIATALRTRYL